MKSISFWRNKFLLTLLASLFILSSCEKDDSPSPEDEENLPVTEIEGRFSNFISCTIIAPPTEVGLNSYYTKYYNCNGIPVIGSAAVPDEAFEIATETTNFLLTDLGAIRNQLIRDGNYIALYPEGGSISDLPEAFPNNGGGASGAYSWNQNFRAAASDVASLLCNPDVGFGHTLVHELGHMIDIGGIRRLNGGFQNELDNLYASAMASGKWDNTYASTNAQEYFAEAFTIWYGVNWIGPEGGDGFRNQVGDRNALQSYDPGLHALLNSSINNLTNLPGCRIPVIPNASANCPGTVTDIDGNVYEVVNIGPLCWMKENLKTTTYNDGTPIQEIQQESEWPNATSGAWAHYNNNEGFDATYGKLYNGYAMTSGKLCPEGWHVPTINELQALVNYAGGDHSGAQNLRSTNFWDPSDFPGNNSSDFNLVPAGRRVTTGSFEGLGNVTNLSSNTMRNDSIFSKVVRHNVPYVFNNRTDQNYGMSCRCVKD